MKQSDAKRGILATTLAFAFMVGAAVSTNTALATGMPVVDGAHIIKTGLGWVQQYRQQIQQYTKQLQQYQTQFRQFEQQYVKGGAFRGSMMSTAEFMPRNLNAGVADQCPASLRDLLSSSSSADTCALIVQTKNARYNAMLDVLNSSRGRNAQLQEIYAERSRIPPEKTGEMVANTNRLEAFGKMMQLDMLRAETQTSSYDKLILALEEDLRMTSNAALDGSSGGVVGGVIRGAALKTALSGARRGDR